jgi:outer membrane protein assembly factor BamE (lipoprotein component of BamABCDE complex)
MPIPMNPKRRFLIISVIFFVAVILFWLNAAIKTRDKYNGFEDVLLYSIYFFDDATEYAPKYSESVFKAISIGSHKEEVLFLLGEPLFKETYANKTYSEIWRYTKAPPDRNYWFRIVLFDQNGIVNGIERKYFAD